jgi:hypothetical protein
MKRYTITVHQSGQPRAYADTYRDFTIKCETTPLGFMLAKDKEPLKEWEPCDLNDEQIKKVAKVIGFRWVEKDDPKDNWAAPHLTSFSKIGPGEWRFKITETYTD